MRPKHELVTMYTARHTFTTQSLLREDFQHQTMQRIWEDSPTPAPVAADTICTVESSAA